MDGPRVAAIILAAGRSRRMGEMNKLTADLGGMPVVRRVAEACLRSRAASVYVVTGYRNAEVREALAGLCVLWAHNPNFDLGQSTSLACGIAALAEDVDAAIICLGDMPGISADTIDHLIDGFDPHANPTICVPVYDGRRGNPVLFARQHFAEILGLSGDVGARNLLERHAARVRAVVVPDPSVLADIDTPDDLAAERQAVAHHQNS